MTKATYDTDFYAWTRAQAEALRAKDWPALNRDHLAEEVDSLGIALREDPARRVSLGCRRARCDGAEVASGERGSLQ
jgi:hypothetical protein